MKRDDASLREFYADAPDDISLDDIDLMRIPSHISLIMDGNGRWAQARGLDRTKGHIAGVYSLRDAVKAGVNLGLDAMSAYAFSTENWRRPQHEVDLLMHLFATTLKQEMPLFHEADVRLRIIGDLDSLPKKTHKAFDEGLEETADHKGMTFALAVNYGSRAEITRACRALAQQAAAGTLDPQTIDEDTINEQLYTTGLPDPELLIRTSGEMRLSNYLLWQLAYTELYVTDIMWPDFDRWELLRAIRAFQKRDRRFGGVVST